MSQLPTPPPSRQPAVGTRPETLGGAPPTIVINECDGRVLCRVFGPLDLASSPELTGRLEPYAGRPVRLVVDLHWVDLLDSTGVRCLLLLHTTLHAAGGQLVVVTQPDSAPARVMRLLGLESFLQVAESVEAAWTARP